MKTRKRKEKKNKKKQKPNRRKTREFSGDRRVSRNPLETRPQHAHPQPSIFRTPAKGEKRENFEREREISDKRRRVFSFSDEPSNHP